MACEDAEWAVRKGEGQVFWEGRELELPGSLSSDGKGEGNDVVAIKTGGHFPGSSVLWWKSVRSLMVADTIFVVPSGVYHVDREPGTTSFSFMWSIPNMVCFLAL